MQQKYLKKSGLIALITLLSMIAPLSTDLYMPALPEMAVYFDVSTSLTSFTMTIFFIFMAIGILILGPLSDKYGRRPILIISVIMSLVFSLACAFAPTISLLIVARALQAAGAGGMVAIATALIRDSFEGKQMSLVLAVTQSLGLLAPMLAPILGAVILQFASWKMTFVALAILMGVSLIGALLLQETLPKSARTDQNTLQSILQLRHVAKNKNFSSLLLLGGLISAPYMGYLAIASYIYINDFGLSETMFSVFFAINSAFAILGPVLYMRLGHLPKKMLINTVFVLSTISALLLYFVGDVGPVAFLFSYVPFTIVSCFVRPFVSDMLLSAQKTDIGAASSLMNLGFTVIGSIGMIVGSLAWSSYIDGLSITIMIFTALALLVWFIILRVKSIQFDWK
ncbi:MAG: Bcr/CflA family efflux MFS transporter [Bacillus sp. (in: firmicutes)]